MAFEAMLWYVGWWPANEASPKTKSRQKARPDIKLKPELNTTRGGGSGMRQCREGQRWNAEERPRQAQGNVFLFLCAGRDVSSAPRSWHTVPAKRSARWNARGARSRGSHACAKLCSKQRDVKCDACVQCAWGDGYGMQDRYTHAHDAACAEYETKAEIMHPLPPTRLCFCGTLSQRIQLGHIPPLGRRALERAP